MFLLHTIQVLYMCSLYDSTDINTIIEFVPHVSGDGFNGGSDSYLQFRDTHAPCSVETVHTAFEWNCGCFPNLVRNCRWTVVPRQSIWITLYVIISINQKLVYHSRGTEYRLLSEERIPIRKNWQQFPSRGLRGALPAPLVANNWICRNLQLRIKP